MFTIPRPNVIESDEGFSVEVLGRAGLRYREPPREMLVDSEVLAGPSGLVVYGHSIRKWEPPYAGEALAEGKRQEILDNIRRAFRYRGLDIQVS
jgi:hypothetical protein